MSTYTEYTSGDLTSMAAEAVRSLSAAPSQVLSGKDLLQTLFKTFRYFFNRLSVSFSSVLCYVKQSVYRALRYRGRSESNARYYFSQELLFCTWICPVKYLLLNIIAINLCGFMPAWNKCTCAFPYAFPAPDFVLIFSSRLESHPHQLQTLSHGANF